VASNNVVDAADGPAVADVTRIRRGVRIIGLAVAWTAGWVWTLLAGLGGLMLLIHEGPLPITNGWFAMFSGFAACPLLPRFLKRAYGVTVSGWLQFAIALLIFIAGRIAVVLLHHRPFLPKFVGW